MPSLAKKFKDLRYSIFYGVLLKRGMPLITLGETSHSCHWTFCPVKLNERSIIYSGGVGNDITFEHALVREFGCRVALFDPSPTGLKTMGRAENQTPQFRFHPLALANHCGTLTFAPPTNPEEGSWFAQSGGSAQIKVACTDLGAVMRENHHDHIDLLKLDIEGSEYEVIDDILKRRIPVRQLCVEYHHGILPGIRRSQTIQSILKLVLSGYRLLDQVGNNHTFLHSRH